MIVKEKIGIELVEKWVHQNRIHGKTNEQMAGTTFVFGDEVISLNLNESGILKIEYKQGPVIIFRQADHVNQPNVCRACGMEHLNYKDAIQCCTNIE